MPDFTKHADVLQCLKESQDAETDNREKAREAHLFVDKRDGQWEPYWWNLNKGKPRYTFDMTSPIIDQVAGEMEQADFNINVKPAGGDATKDIAQVYDGLIRNIENISNATHIFNQAGRAMVTGGIDGWRIVQKYVDGNSFDQDLMIEKISNFTDRVWFEASAELQDKSDAKYCFVLQGVSKPEYKKKYPEGSEQSLGTGATASAYFHKPDLITVGEFYYIKPVERELVLMSDGKVYEVDEKFEKVKDELLAEGVTEERRRKRLKNRVFIRQFDNQGWLNTAKETVFSYLPVIPTYGNFKIFENKTIYWGVVEKLIDAQRVMNYSLSREIEEGALAPRAKYWLTAKQQAGHESTLATLNTNADPVQTYSPDPAAPFLPQQSGGALINPGLRTISESMRQVIGQSAGMFAANMGDNPGLQSGVAIRQLQNKGDIGTIKYFASQEVAICHTAKILIDAIPRVYDTERQVRILKEDGSFDLTTLNEKTFDEESKEEVVLNDLSQGTYDVTCSAGAAFKNRQEETVSAIVEMSSVDPSIIQMGGDVLLNNIDAPGMDLLSARKRQALFLAGAIPPDQMTDEEKEQAQQATQNQQPDAAMVLAQAEDKKAQAAILNAQVKVAQLESNDEKKDQEFALKLEQMQQNLNVTFQEQNRKNNETVASIEKTNAETLKVLREAMGVDTIVGPNNTKAYTDQAAEIAQGGESQPAIEQE